MRCVFISRKLKGAVILAIYVDDGLFCGQFNTTTMCMKNEVLNYLRIGLEIKLLDRGVFRLGFEMDYSNDGRLFLHQSAYVTTTFGYIRNGRL